MTKAPDPKPRSVDDHSARVHEKEDFWHSTMHAMHGVIHVLEHERNARIHLMLAMIALLLGVWLQISNAELAAVFFAVVIVFLAEIFNTAIERTLDLIDIKENARIKLIKDMAAGAVLVAAAAAVAIGFAIFAPHIARHLWRG